MNDSNRRLLPPMGSLQCFLAAARLESFSRAAREVGLTQSAVSRQIATLEDWLQKPLFVRVGRRVVLNDDGRAYFETIAPAIATIRAATARALARPGNSGLSIATLPSFGMRWLAPRLAGLTREMPDMIVDFAARSHEFNFAEESFDAAVHFGFPTWPGVEHDYLFKERAIPVVAPALLAEHPVNQPKDLLHFPLLSQAERRTAWQRWFRHAGVVGVDVPAGPAFEHFLMVAQVAIGGAGVALLPSFMISPELESGALVCPFDISESAQEAYYFVYPAEKLRSPRFARFRDWLLAEAAQETG